jgi:hypothetical protein
MVAVTVATEVRSEAVAVARLIMALAVSSCRSVAALAEWKPVLDEVSWDSRSS